MISKKIAFSDLRPKDRASVLEMMIDGIHSALAHILKVKTHQLFVASLHRDEEFSPERVWASLGDSSRSHFDHAKKAIDVLENRIEMELSKPSKPKPVPDPAPDPAPAVSKKSNKKKKR